MKSNPVESVTVQHAQRDAIVYFERGTLTFHYAEKTATWIPVSPSDDLVRFCEEQPEGLLDVIDKLTEAGQAAIAKVLDG